VAAVGILVVDGVGLAGVVGAGEGGSPPLANAPAEIRLSTHEAPASPPDTARSQAWESSNTGARKTALQKAQSSEAAPATRTSCNAVVYIGDSTSEGMVMPSYLPDPAQRLDAQLARVGATTQHIEISGARSTVETLSGQTNAHDVASGLVSEGFRGCWVLALGTNDTANIYAGSTIGRTTRIERMMSVIGDQPVMWVNLKSLLASGPYAESNMQLWNRALVRSCASYPNMRVFDWESATKYGWFISDGTHYTSEGYAQRARLTADALVRAFPASAKERARGCLVA
jgi:hypothetical protein